MVEIHSHVKAFVTDEATTNAHLIPESYRSIRVSFTRDVEKVISRDFLLRNLNGKNGQKAGVVSLAMTFAKAHLSSSITNHESHCETY